MNTTLEPIVENGVARPASSAFSLHRCNRLSNVLAALKLRQTDGETSSRPADSAADEQPGRVAAPHFKVRSLC
jgi:hypothetical protein